MDEPTAKFLQYFSTLDGRETELCRSLHLKVFDKTDPHIKHIYPPNHFNCRSVLVPIFKGTEIDKTATLPNVEQTDGGFLKLKKEDK